jgi:hypothetical protein
LSDLADIGRLPIGQNEYGLTEAQSRRLRGETADEVRADAKAMRRELGLPVDDRLRDEAGRFRERNAVDDLHASMNKLIRTASGRPLAAPTTS